MQQKIENGTVNANRIGLQNYVVQLNTDDLIELAETGKTGNIELDSMAATILHECLEHAYNEIKDRKGKTVNGVYVKDADLKNGKDNQ